MFDKYLVNNGLTEKDLVETFVDSTEHYSGKVVKKMSFDTIKLSDGQTSYRDVAWHDDAVAILVIDKDNNVMMVKQWRYALNQAIWELPAGRIDGKDNEFNIDGSAKTRLQIAKEAGIRELAEETGVIAKDIHFLGEFYASPGFTNEILYLFVSKLDKVCKSCPDNGEFVLNAWVPFDELLCAVLENKIKDGKTISCVLLAKQYLNL